MQSRTSPLRKALAGLCGPVTRTCCHSLAERLAVRRARIACLQAVCLGLVLTDADGLLAGGLQAVTNDVLDADNSAGTAPTR